MSKMTLLEIVQDILNDMLSDEVNSINDSIESMAVANIVKSTYFDLIHEAWWPQTFEVVHLQSVSDAARPTMLVIDDSINKVEWIKYNKKANLSDKDLFDKVYYLSPEDFLTVVLGRDSTGSNVTNMLLPTGVSLPIYTDRQPTYWTSFDDDFIVFDSYDSDVDNTIQSSKTIARAHKEPTVVLTDGAILDIPAKAFPLFLAEAKSNCFEKIKQAPSAKEEQKARRLRIQNSHDTWRTNGGIKYPNYGRK